MEIIEIEIVEAVRSLIEEREHKKIIPAMAYNEDILHMLSNKWSRREIENNLSRLCDRGVLRRHPTAHTDCFDFQKRKIPTKNGRF